MLGSEDNEVCWNLHRQNVEPPSGGYRESSIPSSLAASFPLPVSPDTDKGLLLVIASEAPLPTYRHLDIPLTAVKLDGIGAIHLALLSC